MPNEFDSDALARYVKLLGEGDYLAALTGIAGLTQSKDPALRAGALRQLGIAHNQHRCFRELADAAALQLLAQPEDFALLLLLVEGHFKLNEIVLARAAFDRANALARSPRQLTALVRLAAPLYDGERLRAAYEELLGKLNTIAPPPMQPLDAVVARATLLLGLGNRRRFLRLMDDITAAGVRDPRLNGFALMAERLHKFPATGGNTPKIFCIGLSKTGTTSLDAALSSLGFYSAHWRNPGTCALLGNDDVPLFDALSDTPISYQFEALYEQFPNAHFIYTPRTVDGWQDSILNHFSGFYRTREQQSFESIAEDYRRGNEFAYGVRAAKIHYDLYFRHDSFPDAYAAFDQRVKDFFSSRPAARFLKLDIIGGEGWDTLCEFLDLPIPAQPFPWQYKTKKRGQQS